MLKTGQLVLVHKIAEKGTKMVHGMNLHSPNLKMKSYKPEQFNDKVIVSNDDINKGLKPAEFYNLDKDNKHHSAEVTQVRYKTLMEAVVGKVPAMAEG